MNAIILSGGFGTRLKHLFPNIPKALVPICGIPFLEMLLSQIDKQGVVSKVVLSLGYQANKIQEVLRDKKFHFEIVYSIETRALGTGGAIVFCLGKTGSSDVFVFNGDSYLDLSLQEMLSFHQEKKADLTIACRQASQRDRYGSLDMDHSQKIVAFLEKQKNCAQAGYINAGIYLFKKEIFEKIPFSGAFSIENAGFPFFIFEKKVFGFPCNGLFVDIGTEESYYKAQMLLQAITSSL